MARGRPKRDDRQKLKARLQMEVNRAIAADKAQWDRVKPPRRTEALLLQQKVMADTRIIGTQNDRIKELCDLIDKTKVKLGHALAELEEYRALFLLVHRLVTVGTPYKTHPADAGISINSERP